VHSLNTANMVLSICNIRSYETFIDTEYIFESCTLLQCSPNLNQKRLVVLGRKIT
jgi:hypothetical protein